MKKQYTKINGIKIAYKGVISWRDRNIILGMITNGLISYTLPNGGWWIVAKEI